MTAAIRSSTEEHLRLTVSFEDFVTTVDGRMSKAKDLIDLNVATDIEFQELKTMTDHWTIETLAMLKNSFNNPDNEYVQDFQVAGSGINFSNVNKPLYHRINEQTQSLKQRQLALYLVKRRLMISDVTINQKGVDLDIRAAYSTDEKLQLILDKLYDVRDDFYYPIKTILEGNGIVIRNSFEIRELAEILSGQDYIEQIGGMGEDMNARITARGAMYIENKRKSYRESYDDINQDESQLTEKINDIIAELKKQGLGQEILYNELHELRELYGTLSKKHWGELLKGKMIDLILAKVTDEDVLKHIYHALTNHVLRLP